MMCLSSLGRGKEVAAKYTRSFAGLTSKLQTADELVAKATYKQVTKEIKSARSTVTTPWKMGRPRYWTPCWRR